MTETPVVTDGEQAVREEFEKVGLLARDFMGVEPEVGKYEVRGLKVKDFKRVKDVVTKAVGAVRQSQEAARNEAFEKAGGDPDVLSTLLEQATGGLGMVEALLGETFDEVMALADDLVEEDEPLDELPYDALLSVIETVVEREDLPRTVARFLRLRQVFSKSLKTKSASDTDAEK
jgi:hypothetical protein